MRSHARRLRRPHATLLLSPHQDDAVLFACFLALEHQAHVVTCFYGAEARAAEDVAAFAVLGLEHTQLPFSDQSPDTPTVEGRAYDLVIAPAYELGGHEQHNLIAMAASRVFADLPVVWYSTYTRTQGRTRGTEVEPSPWMIALKHQALSCYQSQITDPMTRDWFLGDLREYVL